MKIVISMLVIPLVAMLPEKQTNPWKREYGFGSDLKIGQKGFPNSGGESVSREKKFMVYLQDESEYKGSSSSKNNKQRMTPKNNNQFEEISHIYQLSLLRTFECDGRYIPRLENLCLNYNGGNQERCITIEI